MGNTLLQKRFFALFLTLALVLFSVQTLSALDVPPLKGRVNDYARILSPATASQLEEVLQQFEAAESTQIVLLTVPTLAGDSLEDFSLRVVEAWKPGQTKLDNGALLLIAKNDRKLRIEVGYGLEGKLTDLASGRIIRDIITPRFKEGNFDQGVIDGIAAMIAATQGEFANNENNQRQKHFHIDPGTFFIFIVIFFTILGRILSRVPLISAGIGALIAPVFGTLILGMSGLSLLFLAILGFILGLIMAGKTQTGGGFSSGGFGGSGGFAGGSFGGFSGGGGSFGGGGSSGSW